MKLITYIILLLIYYNHLALGFNNFIPPTIINQEDSINTILFEIKSQDTEKISYLFGTHHAFGQTFFESLNAAKQGLLNSDMLIVESLNIPGQLAEDIINQRTLETNWLKYLSNDDYLFVDSIFAKSKIDLNKIIPTELYVFLNRYYNETICQAKQSADERLSLDNYIAKVASDNELKLIGLETVKEQLEIIKKDVEGMPRKVHKKRLETILQKIQSSNNDNCSEIAWYKNMDFDFNFDQPCQNTLVLTNRNNRWLKELSNYLKTKNCFIAVGLSHLMFECGLINQLRKMGYTVTPVLIK
ncbi:TraB/GumN family protein [Chondrinema litorale]|uniref:TraB/GumN family protein n=1 Tax=Chondrinema litorale TaxID=2994555 RepID=UPI00254291E0|nr:TraB/GumN family protein [Chondrinema litorale]UZR99603.1 TraB/GumN family protein [Chondrinema litorale]